MKAKKTEAKKTRIVRRYHFQAPKNAKLKAVVARLLDKETESQQSTLAKFLKAHDGVTWTEIMAFVRAAEPKSKSDKTVHDNYKWHLSQLAQAGLVKVELTEEQVKA